MSKRALFYTLLCVVFWALIPVASKKVLPFLNNFAYLFFSNLISAAVMFLYLVFSKKVAFLKSYSLKEYLFMAFLGFLGSFAYYLLLYRAFALSSAAEIFVINYTWPILVVMLGVFLLDEKLTPVKIISVVISFFGVVIIACRGNPLNLSFTGIKGDLFALAGAFFFALFSVLGKKVRFNPEVAVFVYFLSAAVFGVLTIGEFKIRSPSSQALLWLFLNGAFINGISYIFWFKALKGADTSLVSNLVYLTPFVSLLFIWSFLKEPIHLYSVVALIFIVGGILIHSLKKSTC